MAYDAFVSYARIDDEEGAVRRLVERLKLAVRQVGGKAEFACFMDFEAIEVGEVWRGRISGELSRSTLFLAMLSPSFFRSADCYEEWTAFRRAKEHEWNEIVIPIMVRTLVADGYDATAAFEPRQLEFYREFQELQIVDLGRDRNDDEATRIAVDRVARSINKKLEKHGGVDPRTQNVHVIDERVDTTAKKKQWRDVHVLIDKEPRHNAAVKPVAVIYTGGSVGMVSAAGSSNVLRIGGVKEVIRYLRKLDALDFDVDFYSYGTPIDSSNIDSGDWARLAGIISQLYERYQGFVILHGTNTMAYTASALSFMFENLRKPVVLTGAEIPLIELYSDAESNLMRAIQAAAPDVSNAPGLVPEVVLAFGNYLLRGNRSTKQRSLDTQTGFYSPNYPPLGSINNDRIALNHREILRYSSRADEAGALHASTAVQRDGVMILDVYPDMNLDFYEPAFANAALRGLIIRTYGTGNAPDEPPRFVDCLEQLVDRGVIVVNITQCREGNVELRLFETNARLFDIGVINGGDMTTEAAYCKLKWLLGQRDLSPEQVSREMQIDRRGELTFSAYSIAYSRQAGSQPEASPVYSGMAVDIGHFRFEASEIDHAYARLQDVVVRGNVSPGTNLGVRLYYNRNDLVGGTAPEDPSRRVIGAFQRRIDRPGDTFSHNMEVTDGIRRLIRTDDRIASLQVFCEGASIGFEALRLTILTRR